MARLFISYKREDQDYAFAVRQWLIDHKGWGPEDIFVDLEHLRGGDEWAKKLFQEAEACQAMLFLASEGALHPKSFCYRELRRSGGPILAVTIGELAPTDDRLMMAIPHESLSRQIAPLDQQPVEGVNFVRLTDNTRGSVALNITQLENIHEVLRSLGVAPNSFSWEPNEKGPYPGLRPLLEGDEALFCGRDIEIRDGLGEIEKFSESVSAQALIIQAPSGAGKSSFLRAGLWQRLRRHHGFTPLCIVRPVKGIITHSEWGLISGLFDKRANHLNLPRGDIACRVETDLPELFRAIANADSFEDISKIPIQRKCRTLLLGVDQAEEMTALSTEEQDEFHKLINAIVDVKNTPLDPIDLRLILTVRDDSIDAVRDCLAKYGISHDVISDFRLPRMPSVRFREVIIGPMEAAKRVGWPLVIDPALDTALVDAATKNAGEVGDALPILALTLQRLVANHRRPEDGMITLSPRDAEKFLEEAVIEATETALIETNSSTDDLRRLMIPMLATWDPHAGNEGAAKRKVANSNELFAHERERFKPIAEALVNQHVLTKSGSFEGTFYEVAHEALLRVPPLGLLITERKDKFIQVQMLQTEAKDWEKSGLKEDHLARRGSRITDSLKLVEDEDFGYVLSNTKSPVAQYLKACKEIDQKEQQREDEVRKKELAAAKKVAQRTVAGMFIALFLTVIAIGTSIYAIEQQRIAEQEVVRAKGIQQALRDADSKAKKTIEQLIKTKGRHLQIKIALQAYPSEKFKELFDSLGANAKFVIPSERIKSAKPFIEQKKMLSLPIRGKIIRGFGETDRYGTKSRGFSIEALPSLLVKSPIDGVIVFAGKFRSYGNIIILNVGGGYHIFLAGFGTINVEKGQSILSGETLGYMPPHKAGKKYSYMYIEFRKDGKPIDPAPWFNLNVSSVDEALLADILDDEKFSWPLYGRIISSFGQQAAGLINDGINIEAPIGTEVKAANSGTVAYSGNELRGYGNLILIRHNNHWITAYAHNSELLVKRGQKVVRGQVIAKSGKSGTAVNLPQLHFELRKSEKPVNPIKYLEAGNLLLDKQEIDGSADISEDISENPRTEADSQLAAIVLDAKTGKILFDKNGMVPRSPASLVKVMTLYLLFEKLNSKKIMEESNCLVSSKAARQQPSKAGLKAGVEVSIRDLISLITTKSANDASVVIAECLSETENQFVKKLNEKAKSLGMTNTIFKNSSGLPNGEQKTTAQDMAILGMRIMSDFPILSKYFGLKFFNYRTRRYKNHNSLLLNYKGIDGIKTGYTRASGFNIIASAKHDDKHIIAVVMGGRTARKRDNHARKLLDKYIKLIPIQKANKHESD